MSLILKRNTNLSKNSIALIYKNLRISVTVVSFVQSVNLLLWYHPRGKKSQNCILILVISGQHQVKLHQREHIRVIWLWAHDNIPLQWALLVMNLSTARREGREKRGEEGRGWGESVPLDCTEKISLSDNSSGQFQTTQNDKGINFSRLGYRWIFLRLLFS